MSKYNTLLNGLLNQQENLQIELLKTGDVQILNKLKNVRGELKTLRAQIAVNMSTVGIKREKLKKRGAA